MESSSNPDVLGSMCACVCEWYPTVSATSNRSILLLNAAHGEWAVQLGETIAAVKRT